MYGWTSQSFSMLYNRCWSLPWSVNEPNNNQNIQQKIAELVPFGRLIYWDNIGLVKGHDYVQRWSSNHHLTFYPSMMCFQIFFPNPKNFTRQKWKRFTDTLHVIYHELHEAGDPARRRSSGRRTKKCNFSGSEIQKSDTTFTIQMGVICIVKVVSDLL